MNKLATRMLSLFMVFTMLLSFSPPVIASDSAETTAQTQTEIAGTQIPGEGTALPDTSPAPSASSSSGEAPASQDPQPQEKEEQLLPPSDASASPSPVPEAAAEAAELPQEAPAPAEEAALPRLTALYEGHRIQYIDSPKHPLPAEAELVMAEIPEAEIPLYLRRAAQALGLESCDMYLYFIAAPVSRDASTAEILHFSGDENDPDDRMTVEVTLFDDADMDDGQKAARLQELRDIHIEDLQVILLGARWEDDVVVPHSYDEETGVISFPVSTVDKFILIVPDWETAVYPPEEIPAEPETTEPETVEQETSESEKLDNGTEVPTETKEDSGTEEASNQSVNENPEENMVPENPPAELPETSEEGNVVDSVNTEDMEETADDTEKPDEPAASGDTTDEQTEQMEDPAAAEDSPDEQVEQTAQTDEPVVAEDMPDEQPEQPEQTDDPAAAEDTPEEQAEQPDDSAAAENISEEQTEEPAAVSEGTVTAEGSDYSVSLTYTTDANIPEGSVFELSEVPEGGILYDNLTDSVANTLNADSGEIVSVTFVDVDVKKDGDSVALDAPVNVSIEVDDSAAGDTVTQVVALGTENEILSKTEDSAEAAEGSAAFATETESLSSTYAIVRITKQVTLKTSDDQTWQITVTYDRNDPGIPADAELSVTELLKGTPEYEEHIAASAAATGADPETLSFAKAFDISLIDPATGAECQPAGEVAVSIQLLEETVEENDEIEVVHFGAEEAPKQIDCAVNQEENTVEFATPGFSVFVVMKVIKEQVLTASDGNSYKISVSYDRESGIPEDAQLVVSEIREGDEAYAAYIAQSAEKLGTDPDKVNFARAFDISLKNPETGEEYQPDKSVKVSVTLLDETVSQDSRIDVVHFPGEADGETEIMETNINGEAVEFSTDGFSVYVIIDHEDGEVKEPRVEFHFIDHYTNAQYEAGIDTTRTTVSAPFNFVNTAGKYQTTQILKNGETLELITEPENIKFYAKTTDTEIDASKTYYTESSGIYTEVASPVAENLDNYYEKTEIYFYGWYVVNMESDGSSLSDDGRYTGDIKFKWPESPDQVHFEQAITITAKPGDDGVLKAGDTLTWSIAGVEGTGTLDHSGTAHVYLAPLYEDFYFINFHKGPKEDTSGLAASLMTRKLVVFGSANTAEVRIGNVKCESPDPAHQIFSGWEQKDSTDYYRTVDFDGNEINSPGRSDGYYISVSKGASSVSSLELYPVFVEARWLYFNGGKSGNGSSYVPAAYRLTNNDRQGGDDVSYYFDKTFFDVHMSTRPGFAFEGWYLFANIDGETGEISNLNDPQDVTLHYMEGATKHEITYNTKALKLVNPDETINNIGTYYITNGTISKSGAAEDRLFSTDGGKLRFYKTLDDMTLYANWVPQTVDYTVIYWLENANDDDYTMMHYETKQGVAGSYTDAAEIPVTSSVYNDKKLRFAHLSSGQDKEIPGDQSDIQQQPINGDGSTIVNVYYDRNRYKLRFDIGFSQNGTYYISNVTNSNNGTNDNYNSFLTNQQVSIGNNNPFTTSRYYTGSYQSGNSTVYYYDLKAKFGETIVDRWPDTLPDYTGKKGSGNNQTWYFIGWLTPTEAWYWRGDNGSGQNAPHSSIKGAIETMSEEVLKMWKNSEYVSYTVNDGNGIAMELHCRYNNSVRKYVYRQYFWDPEKETYPADPGKYIEMQISGGSGSTPYGQTISQYVGYKMIRRTWLNSDSVSATEKEIVDTTAWTSYYINSIKDNGMILKYYYMPNLHQIGYKYGKGASNDLIGKDFISTASRPYYYNQSLADANVNQAEAIANTPNGYSFEGWYDNRDGVGNPFNFNTTMPDGDLMLYAVYKPLRYVVNIDPNGAEIDHIDHTNNTYKPYPDLIPGGAFNRDVIFKPDGTTVERPADPSTYRRDKATYVNGTYGMTVDEYSVSRHYVPISDSAAEIYAASGGTIYYYINSQYGAADGSGLPSDCRNALYVTSDGTETETDELHRYWQFYHDWTQANLDGGYITGTTVLDYDIWRQNYVSPQKYRAPNASEHWTFLGWFKDDSAVPYNFSDPVTAPMTLTAHWRLDGGYRIEYVPWYVMPDGAMINGDMPVWLDPYSDNKTDELTYADGASTEIYKAPTGLKKDNVEITDDSVIFRGWALVANVGTDTDPSYTPLERDSSGHITTYYEPSDPYTVNAANADSNSVIYLQAIYQYKDSSDRRPIKANLTLDANTGYINATDLPAWGYPGNCAVNTEDHLDVEDRPTQIEFGDIQSSAAVHLYKYATELKKDAAGNVLDPKGTNYFTHPQGHFLLGFDNEPTEGDYIASYPADSVIAVTRNDNQTIFAVWEPMVYMTLRNETDKELVLSLAPFDPLDTATLEIINIRSGLYDRKKLSDYSSITLKPKDSDNSGGEDEITLAFPNGAEKKITISGTNNLGTGKVLMWDSSLKLRENGEYKEYNTRTDTGSRDYEYTHSTADEGAHQHTLVCGEVNNTVDFKFSESLIVNEEPLVVTFRSRNNDYALIFNDNFPAASGMTSSTQERDFGRDEVLDTVEPVGPKAYSPLPNPNSCPGYRFAGWASTENAAEEFTDSIVNLQEFFEVDQSTVYTELVNNGQTVQRTLYAVWKEYNEARTVYVFKNVPAPGNQDQEFTFDLTISAKYQPKNSTKTTSFSGSGSFSLKHNQYAKLFSSQDASKQPVTVTTEVTLYNTKDDSRVNPSLGDAPDFTIKAVLDAKPGGTLYVDNISVTERKADFYTTVMRRQTQTGGEISLNGDVVSEKPRTVTGSKISWTKLEQRGTVIYNNQRETFDVTLSKTLVSNTTTVHNFLYTVSYVDAGKTTTLYNTDSPLTVSSGSSSVIENVPAGVYLKVTEITDDDKNYVIEASGIYTSGSQNNSAIVNADTENKDEVFAINQLSGDARISYTNTLKSYKVTMKLVDQDSQTTINGLFSLSTDVGTLEPVLYASSDGRDGYDPGVFYISEKLWADTYTLIQTTTPTGYFGPKGEVKLKVTGNGIVSDNEFVIPVQARDQNDEPIEDEYIINVINWKTVNMRLRSGLLDPTISQFTFSYSGTYQLKFPNNSEYKYDLNRNRLKNQDKAGYVELTAYSTGDGSVPARHEPYTFAVPVRAVNLTIEEDTAQVTVAPETVGSTYNIYVQRNNPPAAPLPREEYNKVTGFVYTAPIENANEGDIITFYNERKTEEGSRKVILRKVYYDYSPKTGVTFTVYGGSSTEAYTVFHEDGTSERLENLGPQPYGSGVFWIGTLPYGNYTISESNGKWFSLTVGADSVPGSGDGIVISGEQNTDPRT